MVRTVNGCCGASLRSVGMAHGIVYIALTLIVFTTQIIPNPNNDDNTSLDFDKMLNQLFPPPNNGNGSINMSTEFEKTSDYSGFSIPTTQQRTKIIIAGCILNISICLLLLNGISKNNHYLLLPWLILKAIELIFIILLCYLVIAEAFIQPEMMIFVLVLFIITGLLTWSWNVIYSLYKEIQATTVPFALLNSNC